MQTIRLKAVEMDTDFRKTELENYRDFVRRKGVEVKRDGDAVLLVSTRRNQLVWVLRCEQSEGRGGGKKTIIDTRRWRIEGGVWNPLMLQNYANEVGFHIQGVKRFEDVMREHKASQKIAALERETSREHKREPRELPAHADDRGYSYGGSYAAYEPVAAAY